MTLPHAHTLFVHGDGPLHRLAAPQKTAAALFIMVLAAATPREWVWAFALEAAALAGMAAVGRLAPGMVARRLGIAVPLLGFAVLLLLVGGGPRAAIGPWSVSIEGTWAAWAVLAKGVVCLAASILLTATTTVPDLIAGLQRLGVPRTLTAIAGFMVRYIDVLAQEVRRMQTAMAARGHAPRWWWQAVPSASVGAAVFVRSYQRGERTMNAMLARGYDGNWS